MPLTPCLSTCYDAVTIIIQYILLVSVHTIFIVVSCAWQWMLSKLFFYILYSHKDVPHNYHRVCTMHYLSVMPRPSCDPSKAFSDWNLTRLNWLIDCYRRSQWMLASIVACVVSINFMVIIIVYNHCLTKQGNDTVAKLYTFRSNAGTLFHLLRFSFYHL
jgi:hypothetical protein